MTNKDDKRPSDDLDDLDAFLAGLAQSTPGAPRPASTRADRPGTPRPGPLPTALETRDVDVDVDFDDDDDGATQIGQIPQELLAALGRSPAQQRAETVPPPSGLSAEPATLPPKPAASVPPKASSTMPPASPRDFSWDDEPDLELDSITIPPPGKRAAEEFEDRPTVGFDTPLPAAPQQDSQPKLALRSADAPLDLDDPFAEPTSNPPPADPVFATVTTPPSAPADEPEIDTTPEVVFDVDEPEPDVITSPGVADAASRDDDDEIIIDDSDDAEVSFDAESEIVLDQEDEPSRPTTVFAPPARREPIMALQGRPQLEARSELLVALAESQTQPLRSETLVAAAELAERGGRRGRARELYGLAAGHSTSARRALVRLGVSAPALLLGEELGGDVAAVHGAANAVEALKGGDERAALVALDDAWSKANDPELRVLLASAGADLARSLGDARKAASMRLRSLDENATTGARVAAARELLELGDRAAASDVLLVAAEKEPRVHASDTLRRLGRRLAGHDPRSTATLVASAVTAGAAALRGDVDVERSALESVAAKTGADDRARALTRLASIDALAGDLEAAISKLDESRKLASRSAFVDSTRDAFAAHLSDSSRFPSTPLHREEDAPIAELGRALGAGDASEETLRAILAARGIERARAAADLLAADVAANLGEPSVWTEALAAESRSVPVGFAGLGVARSVVFARAGAIDDAVVALGDGTLDLADAARALLLASRDRDASAAALEASESASLHERSLRARIATDTSIDDLRSLVAADDRDVTTTLRFEQAARRSQKATVEAESLERLASLADDDRDRTMLRLLAASVGGGSTSDLDLAPNDAVLLAEALLDVSISDAIKERAIERLAPSGASDVLALLRARASTLATVAGIPSDAASEARLAAEATPDDAGAAASVELAELGAGQSARISHRLFQIARSDADVRKRARAYTRLAELDRRESKDSGAAVASLGAALELAPTHVPTLRAMEITHFERDDLDGLRSIEARLGASLSPGRSADAHTRLAIRANYLPATDVSEELAEIALGAMARNTNSVRLLRWAEHCGRVAPGPTDLEALARRIELATDDAERVELWLRVAAIAERRGLDERARVALGEAYAIDPTHPVVLFERAIAFDRLPDDHAAAAAHALAAKTAASPVRASFHRLRASARLVTVGALDDAFRVLDEARDADPSNPDVLTALVEIHERRDDPRAALAVVEARIALGGAPESIAAAHELRGRLAERVGEAAIAREAYAAVLAATPEDSSVLRRAADLAIAASDGRNAVDLLIRLARVERNRDELKRIFLELGDAYERLVPDPRRAEASYRRVLQVDPTHAHANARLVEVLAGAGRADDALAVADQLELAAPNLPLTMQLRFSIARAIEKAGDARRAEHLLEDWRKRAPTHAPLIMELAEFYARQGARPALAMHLSRSAADLRRAFEEQSSVSVLECLVDVQRRRGRADVFACTSAAAAAVGLTTDATGAPLVAHIDALGRFARSNEIDDLVAPRILTESTRAALRLSSEAIEKAFPLDARPFKVEKVARDSPLRAEAKTVAEWFGFDDVQVFVTPVAPRICVPVSGHPLTIIVGNELPNVSTPDERTFLFVRAAKIASAGLAFAMRLAPAQVAVALHALVRASDSDHRPTGVDVAAVDEAAARLARNLPKGELHALCLEMASRPEFDPSRFGLAAAEWANRVALLATGRPAPALAGLVHLGGQDFAQAGVGRRIELLRSMPEAFSLLSFALSDMHAEARARGSRG